MKMRTPHRASRSGRHSPRRPISFLGRRRRLDTLLLAVLAAGLRLPHLAHELPLITEEALPLKKAFQMWGWAGGGLQLDPGTAGWPAFSFYVHLLLQHLQYGWGRLSGAFGDRYDYYLAYLTDPTGAVLLARGLGVAAAVGMVVAMHRLSLRLAGRGPALLAAGLLAVSPLLVGESQLITPDILLALFATLALERIVAASETGRLGAYLLAGFWIGLGAATKYTPVLLLPGLLTAHLIVVRREGRSPVRDRRPWLALLVCAAAFVAATPWTLGDLATFRRDLVIQATHLGGGHFGQEARGPGWLYYLRDVLWPALGPPGLLLGLAGLLLAGFRLRGRWLVLLACLLPYYLVLGAMRTSFPRYALPFLPILPLGLAGFLRLLSPRLLAGRRWQGYGIGMRRAVPVLLALIVLAPPVAATISYHERLSRPSTRQLARRYLDQGLDVPHPYLALELYTLQPPAEEYLHSSVHQAVLAHLDDEQRALLLGRRFYPYVFIPLLTLQPERTALFYDLRLYRPYTHLVTSSAVRGRYEAHAEEFPAQVAFYADLGRYATLERVFGEGDGARGPRLCVYRLTERTWAELERDRGPLAADWLEHRPWASGSPQLREFLETIGRHAYERGLLAHAERMYDGLYPLLDEDAQVALSWRLGLLKIESAEWTAAGRLFARWLQAHPDDPGGLANLGLVHQEMGDVLEARRCYERAIAVAPADPAASWARQRLAELTGD
jgi:tetratricopeptide (TPR) repeat protein